MRPVRVIAAHTASYGDPIAVGAGEALTVTDRTAQWLGQIWVRAAFKDLSTLEPDTD